MISKIIKTIYSVILFSIVFNYAYSSLGGIYGEIVDIDTHQPLPGANVMLENTAIGTGANNKGVFKIDKIPVGSYTVTISMIGYSTVSRTNINIYSNRQTPLKFYLQVADHHEKVLLNFYQQYDCLFCIRHLKTLRLNNFLGCIILFPYFAFLLSIPNKI